MLPRSFAAKKKVKLPRTFYKDAVSRNGGTTKMPVSGAGEARVLSVSVNFESEDEYALIAAA
jgi:hypothetical protein